MGEEERGGEEEEEEKEEVGGRKAKRPRAAAERGEKERKKKKARQPPPVSGYESPVVSVCLSCASGEGCAGLHRLPSSGLAQDHLPAIFPLPASSGRPCTFLLLSPPMITLCPTLPPGGLFLSRSRALRESSKGGEAGSVETAEDAMAAVPPEASGVVSGEECSFRGGTSHSLLHQSW